MKLLTLSLALALATLVLPAQALAPPAAEAEASVETEVMPATFTHPVPASFRFTLRDGLDASALDLVVWITYPLGIQGADEPTPPAGWRVTRYEPEASPASVELSTVAMHEARGSACATASPLAPTEELPADGACEAASAGGFLAVNLPVQGFTCAGGFDAYLWHVHVRSMSSALDEKVTHTTVCDRLAPRLVSDSGHVVASVRSGSAALSAVLVDEPAQSEFPVFAFAHLTPPTGAARTLSFVDGQLTLPLAAGEGGVWRYHITAQDQAGNAVRVPAEGEYYLNASEPAPVVTVVGTPTAGWFTASPQVSVSVADPGSDASTIDWSVASVGTPLDPSSGTGPATLTLPTGVHTLDVTTTDALGVAQAAPAQVFSVDTRTPTATFTLDQPETAAGWVPAGTVMGLSVTFGPSAGTASWTLDGTARAKDATAALTAGDHTAAWSATSTAGLVGSGSRTIRADGAPPVITSSVAGDGADGVFAGPVTLTASATDAGSGLASLVATVDDGAPAQYTAPIVVSGDGEHTVSLAATDAVGLVATAEHTFRIDTIAPVLTLSIANETLLANETATLSLSLADAGPVSAVCTLDGAEIDLATPVEVAVDGAHEARCEAVDEAGNAGEVAELAFHVDRSPPAIAFEGDLGATNVPLFADTATDVAGVSALEARYVDADGGITPLELAEGEDGFEPTSLPDLAEGTYRLQLRATDAFQRVSGWEDALVFDLVTTAPSLTVTAAPEEGDWVSSAQIEWTLSDHPIPVWAEASLDGGAYALVESPLMIVGDGERTLLLRARDEAGNVGAAIAHVVRLDTVAPDVADPLPETLYTNVETFTWSPAGVVDAGAPVVVELRVNGAEAETIAFEVEGRYEVGARAVDAAGNVGPWHESAVVIDRVAPVVEVESILSSSSDGTIAWSAADGSPLRFIGASLTDIATGAEHELLDPTVEGAAFEALPEGAYTLLVTLADEAGNVAPPASAGVVVDLTAPTLSIAAPAWTNGDAPVLVEVSAMDAWSGIAALRLQVTDAAGVVTVQESAGPTASFGVDAPAPLTIEAFATDEAGWQSDRAVLHVSLDEESPVLTTRRVGSAAVASATDALDPSPTITYQVCGSSCDPERPYLGGEVRLDSRADRSVRFIARDHAGNEARDKVVLRQDEEPTPFLIVDTGPAAEPETTEEAAPAPEPEEAPADETTSEEPPAEEPAPADEPAPTDEVAETPAPVAEPIDRSVRKSARSDGDRLLVEGDLAFENEQVVLVEYRLGDGELTVAPAGLIPLERIAPGEHALEVQYTWADGERTAERLVVVRPEAAAPEAPLESTGSTDPPAPPEGAVGAQRGTPGVGLALLLAGVAVVALLARRRA